ncbi:GTPase domain-containing protein [Nocardioides sp. GXZ039]|uniref:GTPase domain-containing protein n=1 Tax=Nocardioides sp. GXZ039 TaxID=3136018 RepID=UPI0030F467B8
MAPGSSRSPVGSGPGFVRGVPNAVGRGRDRVRGLFRHRFPTVAVTGMTGVGKTELVDHLCGRAAPEGTSESGSAVMERRVSRDRRLRGFRFRVVPGENAATRLGALDEVFHDEPVDGVLHVVANGYATGRRPAGTTGAAVVDRDEQLARELEDWTVTAHRIAAMAVRRPHPTWLVIVVTKVDLYADDVDAVVRSYSPGSGTPFGDRLDDLRALAGAAKLSIDVLPACSHLDGTAISPDRRDAYLAALENRMAQLSGHV